jgi:hypothetical protein
MLRFRRRRILLGAALGLAALVLDGRAAPTAFADTTSRAKVEVVLLAGPPQGDATRVFRVPAGATEVPAPLATLRHRAGAAVRGATLPDGGVGVVADLAPGDDLSFAATLFHVSAKGGSPKALCDRVVHASRPLPLPDGRIAVARGVAGTASAPGASREDDLTLDAVDPATGDARTLLRAKGSLLFAAGLVDRRVLVYRITATGADLVSVDPAGGAPRVLVRDLPAFARDFDVSPRGDRVVFVDRHPTDARTWQVLSLDVASGALTTVTESASLAQLPFVLDDGAVAVSGADHVARVGGAPLTLPAQGHFQLLGRSRHGGSSELAGLLTQPGKLGRPVVLKGDGTGASLVAAPAGERIAVAGLVVRGAR